MIYSIALPKKYILPLAMALEELPEKIRSEMRDSIAAQIQQQDEAARQRAAADKPGPQADPAPPHHSGHL